MLRGLASDQSSIGLTAALCHAFYNIRDLFRIILSAGNIIQEKQRLTACTGDVIDTHGHSINADGVMLVHDDGQLYLGSASVCSGKKNRVLHLLDLCQGKAAGKTADSSQYLRTHGALYMLLHQFHRLVSGLNVYSSVLVIHIYPPFAVPAASVLPPARVSAVL